MATSLIDLINSYAKENDSSYVDAVEAFPASYAPVQIEILWKCDGETLDPDSEDLLWLDGSESAAEVAELDQKVRAFFDAHARPLAKFVSANRLPTSDLYGNPTITIEALSLRSMGAYFAKLTDCTLDDSLKELVREFGDAGVWFV